MIWGRDDACRRAEDAALQVAQRRDAHPEGGVRAVVVGALVVPNEAKRVVHPTELFAHADAGGLVAASESKARQGQRRGRAKERRAKGRRAKGRRAKGRRAKGRRAKGRRAKGRRAKGRRAKGRRAKGRRAKGRRAKGLRATDAEGASRLYPEVSAAMTRERRIMTMVQWKATKR